MADNHRRIVEILIKNAGNRRLKKAEARFLKKWMEQSDEHRQLPEKLYCRLRQKERRRQLEEAPSSAEVWENIRRRLEETGVLSGINRPASVTRYWLAKAAVVVLLMLGGDLLCDLPGNRKVVQTLSKDSGYPASLSVKSKEGSVRPSVVLFAVAPVDEMIPCEGTPVFRTVDIVGPTADADVPVKRRMKKFTPAPATVDSGSLFHYCSAVVATRSRDIPQMEHTVAYPYSYYTKALLGILSHLEGPIDIHLPDGKQVRLAGNRRFENAGVDSPVRKWPDPAAQSPGFLFNDTELDRVLAEVAEWYGLKVSNPGRWRGVAITGKLVRASRPDSVLNTLRLLENGFVQLRWDQKVIFVSGAGTKRGF
ncbi:MAG TPA: DUF4974 domain-containing protein [Puia sp.]|uniref:DUF4974 domain-containing protein n=1 Tax=Puia sp. TaxID=2045100 RepID=UPI002C24C70E|nr:DUF4974 domain-containing protein [Puia sp.]HVU95467.1 DUF4974 domain-containing protein [Puia sp.]